MKSEPHLQLLSKVLTGDGAGISRGEVLVFEPLQTGWLSLLEKSSLTVWEPSKPAVDALEKAGIHCTLDPSGSFALIIVICTKFKARNLWNIARAWLLLDMGGMLICAIENSCGGPSLARFLGGEFGAVTTFSGSGSKVLQIKKTAENADATLAEYLKPGEGESVEETGLIAFPGVFSAQHPDPGSTALLSAIPASLHGRGADLGAGYGYVSWGIARKCPAVTGIDLFEIDALAVRAAERNLSSFGSRIAFQFHWQDALTPIEGAPFDWVAVNPPFHSGKKVALELGRAFVRRAADLLRAGGECYLVANITLPYEGIFSESFAEWAVVLETRSYKVFRAIK